MISSDIAFMLEKTSQITLSVIVPCFNVEPFLDRTLGCLERQWDGRTDYEIIFVNDFSSDGTIGKLKEFKNRYPDNVIVIDKIKNEGVAMARNSGLEIARGDWIAFFDPDDALVDNGYRELLRLVEANDMDILSFGVSSVNDGDWTDDLTKASFDNLKLDWNGIGQDYVLKGFSGVCWRFLFKRELLENRCFPSLTLLEDLMFTLPLFLNDVKVAQTHTVIYYYIQHITSATNMVDARKLNRGCDDMVTVLCFLSKLKMGLSVSLQQVLKDRQTFYAVNLLSRLLLSDKSVTEIKHIRQELEQLSILPFPNLDFKMRLRNLVFYNQSIFPILRMAYRFIRFKNANGR